MHLQPIGDTVKDVVELVGVAKHALVLKRCQSAGIERDGQSLLQRFRGSQVKTFLLRRRLAPRVDGIIHLGRLMKKKTIRKTISFLGLP